MSQTKSKNHKRINIPFQTPSRHKNNRFVKKNTSRRSTSRAIYCNFHEIDLTNLREQLKEGAIANAERDREIVRDGFSLNEEKISL